MTVSHQQKQKEVIATIAQQIQNNSLQCSTVSAVNNYEQDPRMCLTTVHFPKKDLLDQIYTSILAPLTLIEPNIYFYPNDCLHMTIKNIRVIHDPPNFTDTDIQKAYTILNETVRIHHAFNVYFYRLLLFPNNIALIGTTDEELDQIFFDIDTKLTHEGIADDKVYVNSSHFFSNITLARFASKPSQKFIEKVNALSTTLSFSPYTVDTISLVSCNAVCKQRTNHGFWKLQ